MINKIKTILNINTLHTQIANYAKNDINKKVGFGYGMFFTLMLDG